MTRQFLFSAFLITMACGDDDGGNSSSGTGCGSCSDSEVCVIEFSDPKVERCEAIPEVCGDVGDCADSDCISAMYDYCPEATTAFGCSDSAPPTYISCTL